MNSNSAESNPPENKSGRAIDGVSPNLSATVRQIELTCQAAVAGRLAARALADWARRFALSESDFQAMWRLNHALHTRLDQTTLARHLALSTAQVSNTVDRLSRQGWIAREVASCDRRRHLWQLTPGGKQLLERMLIADCHLHYELGGIVAPSEIDRDRRKEAA